MKDFTSSPFQVAEAGPASAHANQIDVVDDADVLSFQHEMNAPLKTETSFANQIVERFSAVTEDISVKKEAFESKLKKASRTGDTADMLEATRAMSDYQLQVAMSTKVASKTSSAIDKIANLQ